MSQNQTDPNVAPKAPAVLFDHEKLDVYQLELRFIAWVNHFDGSGDVLREESPEYIAEKPLRLVKMSDVFSLAPGFSPVLVVRLAKNRFNSFPRLAKPLKRLTCRAAFTTNETNGRMVRYASLKRMNLRTSRI